MNEDNQKNGIIVTIIAYIIWGFLPIYWKLVDHVAPGIILAERVIWSFILMVLIIVFSRNITAFVHECRIILRDRKRLLGISFASFFISINWLTYIWAVNSEYVIEASLGYYINPLINILLGIIILKERMTRRQILACIIAGVGVLNLTLSFGVFPWVSFILAISFAIYGILKKTVDIGPMFGLTIETMIITPIAFIYILLLPNHQNALYGDFSLTSLLLIGAGLATAIPLLLFAYGTKRIPFIMLGFLQYIAPTIMLVIGIFMFNETFSTMHFISFAFIWVALIIYMMSSFQRQAIKQKVA